MTNMVGYADLVLLTLISLTVLFIIILISSLFSEHFMSTAVVSNSYLNKPEIFLGKVSATEKSLA